VDECAELGGGHSSGGLVMDDVRTLLWIATLFIPLVVREPENQKRNYEWGPPNECRQLLVGPAWTAGDVSRRPTDSDCQTLVGIESLRRSEGDFILVDFRARGGSSLSHRSGVDGDAGRFDISGQNDAAMDAVDAHRPLVARHVPVKLVEGRLRLPRVEKANRI